MAEIKSAFWRAGAAVHELDLLLEPEEIEAVVRAVLNAFREPSEKMLAANDIADIDDATLRKLWSAMIAAAEGGE